MQASFAARSNIKEERAFASFSDVRDHVLEKKYDLAAIRFKVTKIGVHKFVRETSSGPVGPLGGWEKSIRPKSPLILNP